jgi:hypothetical protein
MNVTSPTAQIHNFTLTKYQQPRQILQRITIPPALVFPDDIIDCVAIETGKPAPANMQIINYTSSIHQLTKEKGTIIDIRV